MVSSALGDGCYIPERAVRKIPEISAQRAILAWKDGKETLVISSALDSESQKLGWIIPLPAVPDVIEKQSPGALKTLNFCIQPMITHDTTPSIGLAIFAAFLGNLVLGTFLFIREWFFKVLILIMLGFLFSGLLLPACGVAGGAARTSQTAVSVEKSTAVGAYDVSVIKATKAGDLNTWLEENGFSALPSAADKIVEDYAAKGWVFAAIKLVRGESGENAPHPIKMQFASKEAIYPMRLTSIAGGNPRFEIFVVADQKASCPAIPEEFCDRFAIDKLNYFYPKSDPKKAFIPEEETKTKYQGVDSNLSIGHPTVQELMWDQCVLTKFAGQIDSEKMTDDLQFSWIPFKAYRQHWFTPQGAKETAAIYFFAAAGIWVFSAMIIFHRKIKSLEDVIRYFYTIIVPVLVILAIADYAGYRRMPKLENSDVRISRGFQHHPADLHWWMSCLLNKHPYILKYSNQDIADAILKHAQQEGSNDNGVTGGDLKREDSPGNFTVDRENDRAVIRVYDFDGSVTSFRQSQPEK
jgi:hypothetical protein